MPSETFATTPNAPPDQHSNGGETPIDAAANLKSRESSQQRAEAVHGLENAAANLHAKAQTLPGGARITRAAHATADTLTHTAEYIRKHDAAKMLADAKRVVKDNPAFALLGAALIGFALGRFWSRD